MIRELIQALENEEFTGDNRCKPCTTINLVLAALVSLMVSRWSRILGGAVAVASVAVIYIRGYLVPGTPKLTMRYLPAQVLRSFGKAPAIRTGLRGNSSAHVDAKEIHKQTDPSPGITASATGAGASLESGEDAHVDGDTAEDPTAGEITNLGTFFVAYDVLEPNETGEDLRLTEAVNAELADAMEPFLNEEFTAAMVAKKFGFDSGANLDLQRSDDAYVLTKYGRPVGDWPSRAALIADLAASEVLRSRVPDWQTLSPEQRGELLNALRMFLEQYPDGSETVIGEAVVESCCSSQKVIAVTCEESGERLFEHPM